MRLIRRGECAQILAGFPSLSAVCTLGGGGSDGEIETTPLSLSLQTGATQDDQEGVRSWAVSAVLPPTVQIPPSIVVARGLWRE